MVNKKNKAELERLIRVLDEASFASAVATERHELNLDHDVSEEQALRAHEEAWNQLRSFIKHNL